MIFFKKKTKVEKMAFRVNAVLSQLTSESDFSFTDLETVQILNEVKRKYIEKLKQDREYFIDQSIQMQQKADELKTGLLRLPQPLHPIPTILRRAENDRTTRLALPAEAEQLRTGSPPYPETAKPKMLVRPEYFLSNLFLVASAKRSRWTRPRESSRSQARIANCSGTTKRGLRQKAKSSRKLEARPFQKSGRAFSKGGAD